MWILSRRLVWFTLVESLITIVIMWILIWVLFEIFVTIGRISVFVQLNRTVHSELIYVGQTLQNLVDNQDIQLTWIDLQSTTYGRKDSVRFADSEYMYEISNNCVDQENCFLQLYRIEMNPDLLSAVDSGSVAITDPNTVNVSSFAVRTLPYGSPTDYEQILHKWFWFFVDMRVPQYDETKWRYKVQQQVEMFFTMRKYE